MRVSGFQTTGTAIQNPFTFYYTQNGDWSSGHNYDYWNKNFTSFVEATNIANFKTIYDPSVSGFLLPKTAAFTGFTDSGQNSNNVSSFNVSGVWNAGWAFYTESWKSGKILFFKALGLRNSNDGIMNYKDVIGVYWTNGTQSNTKGNYLAIEVLLVYPHARYYRSSGYSCWSVLE